MPWSRLGAYIELSGLRQADLADTLGVRAPTVNRYSKGVRQPRRAVERKLSEVTFGLITGSNCADPITEAEAASMMAEIERRAAAAGARHD